MSNLMGSIEAQRQAAQPTKVLNKAERLDEAIMSISRVMDKIQYIRTRIEGTDENKLCGDDVPKMPVTLQNVLDESPDYIDRMVKGMIDQLNNLEEQLF